MSKQEEIIEVAGKKVVVRYARTQEDACASCAFCSRKECHDLDCNMRDIIAESVCRYAYFVTAEDTEQKHPVPADVQEAAEKYGREKFLECQEYGSCGESDLAEAYAAGMLAERERMEKAAAYFPEYDSIVNKVFGAGNLESWELDEAKRLVWLAKAELLKELASCQTIKGFVARDANGILALYDYEKKPTRREKTWRGSVNIFLLDEELLPDLRWEDEPREVEIIIKEVKK